MLFIILGLWILECRTVGWNKKGQLVGIDSSFWLIIIISKYSLKTWVGLFLFLHLRLLLSRNTCTVVPFTVYISSHTLNLIKAISFPNGYIKEVFLCRLIFSVSILYSTVHQILQLKYDRRVVQDLTGSEEVPKNVLQNFSGGLPFLLLIDIYIFSKVPNIFW